jgi:hypothetical protein
MAHLREQRGGMRPGIGHGWWDVAEEQKDIRIKVQGTGEVERGSSGQRSRPSAMEEDCLFHGRECERVQSMAP